MVDAAWEKATQAKRKIEPAYHEKLDAVVERYSARLAANLNQKYEIETRMPSVMIAGAGNFSVTKKEKQNQAREKIILIQL